MWKALIKLVEKWGYRCDHEFEMVMQVDNYSPIYDSDKPETITQNYVCSRCGEHKKLRM